MSWTSASKSSCRPANGRVRRRRRSRTLPTTKAWRSGGPACPKDGADPNAGGWASASRGDPDLMCPDRAQGDERHHPSSRRQALRHPTIPIAGYRTRGPGRGPRRRPSVLAGWGDVGSGLRAAGEARRARSMQPVLLFVPPGRPKLKWRRGPRSACKSRCEAPSRENSGSFPAGRQNGEIFAAPSPPQRASCRRAGGRSRGPCRDKGNPNNQFSGVSVDGDLFLVRDWNNTKTPSPRPGDGPEYG